MRSLPRFLPLLALAAFTLPLAAKQPARDDNAAIERAALHYVDGFYAGEPDRVESGVHPSLQKVMVQGTPWGEEILQGMDRHTLVEYARIGGERKAAAERKVKVTNLGVSGNVATVAIDSADFLDYAHVARINGEWRIINVLWAPHTEKESLEVSAEDRAAIEKAGSDYVDGFYAGSAERISDALHPRLQKVAVRELPNGREYFQYTVTDGLVGYTGSGMGVKPEDERHVEVTVLAVFGNIATISIDSADFLDYAHVAKLNGKWKIVNVLWRPHSEQRK
jgi:hypothetical protein